MQVNRQKVVLVFGVGYLVAVGIFVWALKGHKANFSEEKLQVMMRTKAKTNLTPYLCQFAIKGDPSTSSYYKIKLVCNNGATVLSTIALEAVPGETVLAVVKEYARIIGFDYRQITEGNWVCVEDKKPVLDFNRVLQPKATLECFENSEYVQ